MLPGMGCILTAVNRLRRSPLEDLPLALTLRSRAALAPDPPHQLPITKLAEADGIISRRKSTNAVIPTINIRGSFLGGGIYSVAARSHRPTLFQSLIQKFFMYINALRFCG